MYCSSCGVAVAESLSYCNYCGAKLGAAKGDSIVKAPGVKPELLVSAMTALFIFGLIGITVMMGMLKTVLELPVERVLAVSLVPFLLLLLLEGVFMRLLLRSKRSASEALDNVSLTAGQTKELDAKPRLPLPEPITSVTDHTTRSFDPSYRERISKRSMKVNDEG